MITHLVAWKFKPESEIGAAHSAVGQIVKEKLESLPALIPEIRAISAGTDMLHTGASYDFALVARFDSLADLETYRMHPDHVKVGEYITSIAAARVAVDFESD